MRLGEHFVGFGLSFHAEQAIGGIGWDAGVRHKHQPLHDKINPKDCQVASPLVKIGFQPNFLGLFQVTVANPGCWDDHH